MDISVIDATKVTPKNGLMIGQDNAPIKIIEFMNVRCPYCKKWFETYDTLLNEYVEKGQVQRVIKLFDKEKESLQRGNVLHHYIKYDSPEKSLSDLRKMFATQEQWGDLSLSEVAAFAKEKLGLVEQKNSTMIESVIAEANAANIKFVPTIIINDHIFDESITQEQLIQLLSK